jgi:HK97 family phage major capsid protein
MTLNPPFCRLNGAFSEPEHGFSITEYFLQSSMSNFFRPAFLPQKGASNDLYRSFLKPNYFVFNELCWSDPSTVTSPETEPTNFTIRDAVYMEKTLIENKALKGKLSFLFDPSSFQNIQNRQDSNGQTIFDLDQGRRSLLGYNVAATTHMPSNTVLFGNWAEFLVATYGGIALAADDGGTNFAKGTRSIRAILPIDFGVRHGASFVKAASA